MSRSDGPSPLLEKCPSGTEGLDEITFDGPPRGRRTLVCGTPGGAKRIVLDTIEKLFAKLPFEGVLRAEIKRLFQWLKNRKVTAIITGERGDKSMTRHGLEDYVADCAISLDPCITDQIATRRLRIVKYRGSQHGPDEYPFLIDDHGVSVLPDTSLLLRHAASIERVSSGVERLDTMRRSQSAGRA